MDSLGIVRGRIAPVARHLPYGTLHSSQRICQRIWETEAFAEIVCYFDEDVPNTQPLPKRTSRTTLKFEGLTSEGVLSKRHDLLYLSGSHFLFDSFSVRSGGAEPIAAEIGSTHFSEQWVGLLIALCQGSLRPSDGLIVKSSRTADILHQTFHEWKKRYNLPSPPKVRAIPNGIDPSQNFACPEKRKELRDRLRLDNDDVVFLTFNRIAPYSKINYEELLEVWGEVVKNCPKAVLVIAGAIVTNPDFTQYPSQLVRKARALEIADNVRIIADPFDVWPDAGAVLMSGADAFIHTSKGLEEASPNVVLEAQAHSLPIIATDWSGIPDIVSEGETAILIPTKVGYPDPGASYRAFSMDSSKVNPIIEAQVMLDSQALNTAITLLATSPSTRKKMAESARRKIEDELSLERVVGRRLDFFQELVSGAVQSELRPPLIDFRSIATALSSPTP